MQKAWSFIVLLITLVLVFLLSSAMAADDLKFDLPTTSTELSFVKPEVPDTGLSIQGYIPVYLGKWTVGSAAVNTPYPVANVAKAPWYGVEAEWLIGLDKRGDTIYPWASFEQTDSFTGAKGDVPVIGVGLGGQYRLFESIPGLKVFGEVGYYTPVNKPFNSTDTEVWWNWMLATAHIAYGTPVYPPIQKGSYGIQGSVGGTLGLQYNYHVYKGLNGTFKVGYRYLQFREVFKGYIPGDPAFVTPDLVSFSGLILSAGMTW